MHGRKYRNAAATCDVVFVNSAYTGRDVTTTLGVPAERIRVAHPGAEGRLPRGRPGGRSRRAVRPHGRDARAAQEPAGARRGASPPRWRPRARGRRRRGLGRAAAARRPADPAPRLRLGRGARASLPRCGRRRVSVALRGLRDPGDRGDGLRRPGRRLGARVARRGERRRRGARRSRGSRRVRRRDRARARPSASASSRSASSTRRRSPGARSARSSCAATRRRAR